MDAWRENRILCRFSLVLACLTQAGGIHASEVIGVSGYAKNIWQASRSILDQRPYNLNIDRMRLSLESKVGYFRAHVDYDHEVFAGSYFKTLEYPIVGLGEPPTWLAMDQTVAKNATSLWRHRMYRGWAGLESDNAVARFGRQRIAWGTGKLWNPTDILNPYRPLLVERDEQPGVDVLYLRKAAGELSQLEAAYAPQDRWASTALLSRWKSHADAWDFGLMGGKAAHSSSSWVMGGEFAGDLAGGSLYGEWSYTDFGARRPCWRAVLGYQYSFTQSPASLDVIFKDAQIIAEYFHNGAGSTNIFRYQFSLGPFGGDMPAKDYLGLSYARDLHPLVKLEWLLIANINDMSEFFSPSLQVNAWTNLYLSAGFQRFGGDRRTEFGRLPNISFLQAQYYF